MRLPPLPLVVLDTETTGFVPRTHRVIEFASVQVRDGKQVDTYDQLFFHEEVPPMVEVLTHIYTEDLAGQPRFEEKRDLIASKIPEDCIIVGQNVLFDIGMLKGEGIDLTDRPWIDTSILASLVFPELESYSLGYLSTILQLNHTPKHRALGDVHATLELLGACWERLLDLTPALREQLLSIMERAPEGYRTLFLSLPAATKKKAPSWLHQLPADPSLSPPRVAPTPLSPAKKGTVTLREEPLDAGHLMGLLDQALEEERTYWCAVKNLDSAVRRLPPSILSHAQCRVVYPSTHLLDPDAAKRLAAQTAFTADEATLAAKVAWYQPVTRNDLPLHGGEETVWRSLLACTESSQAYAQQFDHLPRVVLIDHRQFLAILDTATHPAHSALKATASVIVDDASMLEDTATKAYGWYCHLQDLRAASTQSVALGKLTDLVQLWVERTRQGQDVRALAPSDLSTPDMRGLREQIVAVRDGEHFPQQILMQLHGLARILDAQNLEGRFAWIEIRQDGSQTLQSVPESIGALLQQLLYECHPTTLLIPPGSGDALHAILPETCATRLEPLAGSEHVPIAFPPGVAADAFLEAPPAGKTVILLSGRGAIENKYVKYNERLEKAGVTLVCQGVSGGQGRMRAEFLAAKAPAIWLLTPWTFEGIELPPDTVDHLVVTQLPFDYYSHPVLSRRAARFRDAFADYFFPRLLHRLFRILRTFCRFKTTHGDVVLLDERLRTKGYGKEVIAYLSQFAGDQAEREQPALATPSKKSKGRKKAGGAGQMTMF